MGSLEGVQQVVNTLLHSKRYRNIKVVVDALLSMAMLGGVSRAKEVFDALLENGHFKQGNLILNYILFVYRSISIDQAHDLLTMYISDSNKHGPLWFFMFSVYEDLLMHSWNGTNMLDRIQPRELLASYEVALRVVSSELRWKIYYIATQMLLRTFTHIRLSLSSNVCYSLDLSFM